MADGILRALTEDQAFRIVIAETTGTARDCAHAQGAAPELISLLGEMVTGVVLFRHLMSPAYRVQGILRSPDGKSSLLGDSHPDGDTRALVRLAANQREFSLANGAQLQLMRSLPNGSLNQGFADAGPGASLSDAFMSYMQVSEQVTTFVNLGAPRGDEGLIAAGGFMVQLLPDAPQDGIRDMVARLERLGDLDAYLIDPEFNPEWLLRQLIGSRKYTVVGQENVRCHCWCSEERVLAALSTLDRSEIEDIIKKGEVLDVGCDYCHASYRIQPATLAGLLNQS
jgi:molecular chaperone Hsp33